MDRSDVLVSLREDSTTARLTDQLEIGGWRVTRASTLRATKQILRREAWEARPHDHIVADLLLSDGSVFELLPLIGRLCPSPVTVTVIGGTDELDADRSVQLWCSDIALLIKPVRFEHLLLLFARERRESRAISGFAAHYGLTGQERAVFDSWFAGLERKQAAAALGISESTIGTYWQRIARRARCDSENAIIRHFVRWVLGVDGLRPQSWATMEGRTRCRNSSPAVGDLSSSE